MSVPGVILGILAGAACSPPESRTAHGVVATDSPRVWVVRATIDRGQVVHEIYRCADGADDKSPPKPVCVKAPMSDSH
jgi:hypothetical protein